MATEEEFAYTPEEESAWKTLKEALPSYTLDGAMAWWEVGEDEDGEGGVITVGVKNDGQ